MWNAYSISYIRNNKSNNKFIIIISFLASMFLSFIGSLFYNLWMDHIHQINISTGTAQVEFTPIIIATIIVFIIASFSLILMIHHAFATTMTNRIHQLGILESIGATPKQIKRTLINEIVVLSLPAIIIGNIIGIFLCWILMLVIINLTTSFREYVLSFTYSPIVFIGSFLFSLLTIIISSWIPSRKLSHIKTLEAINYGNEPFIKRVKKYLFSSIFGIYSELAYKSLYVRRKAMRIGTISIFLAIFACISLLNILGISNLSTKKTYFDRFKDNWDFIITTNDTTYSKNLLNDIRNIDNVKSSIVHQIVMSNAQIEKNYLSNEVKKIGLENLNNSFVVSKNDTYNIEVPIFVLDDNSFEEYCKNGVKTNVIAVNIIWDSINSKRTNRQYIPLLDKTKEIPLSINDKKIHISSFSQNLPILREELKQYSLTLVMPETYYTSIGFNLVSDKTTYTIKLKDNNKYEETENELKKLMESYSNYDFEGRIEERENELKIQLGLRVFVYICTGLLLCIGLTNIFASTLGQIYQRKREFARYFSLGLTPKGATKILTWEAIIISLRPILLTIIINIPLLVLMLNAGGISAQEFISERLPLIPAIVLFSSVIGFVALAYYLGGKKICNMNIIEIIKNDTLSM